jgi:hypothetical protein
MIKTTKEQREALKIQWVRWNSENHENGNPLESYYSFRRRVQSLPCDDCIMIQRGSIWIGIETDGYAHS